MVLKMREMMKRRDNQKGFTLVELIVVMAILAVLAGIAVPKFTGILTQSKQDANDANVDMIIHAAEIYYDSHNQTVPDMDDLEDGYLKANPKDPVSGDAEGYEITATDSTITIKPGKYKGGADGTTDEHTSGTAYNLQ